jgi:hypothetical protein
MVEGEVEGDGTCTSRERWDDFPRHMQAAIGMGPRASPIEITR